MKNTIKNVSCAEWPEGTLCGRADNTSRVKERSEAAAINVCRMLQENGFGGENKIFPIRTWQESENNV